jgi:hypothetical protein
MEAHNAEANEPIAFIVEVEGADSVDTVLDDVDEECIIFDSDEMEECLIYYDWLADTAATSHITH